MTQGAQTSTLWQPREVGWGGRWEGGPRGRGHMYGWLMLMNGRNQHKLQSCYHTTKNKYMKEKILPIVEPLATGFILKKKKKIESISLSPVIVNSHLSQVKVKVKSLSLARLFVTPWTAACIKLLRPWDFLGKSTGVGCHFLLQSSSMLDLL